MMMSPRTGPFYLYGFVTEAGHPACGVVAGSGMGLAEREASRMSWKGRRIAVCGDETSIRVLVVDDHIIVRQGLRMIMEEEPDMEVAGEAGSAEELMQKMVESEWDVVLLDITLPDRSGLEALRDIKDMRPNMPVLILSMHPEEQYANQALKSGASGYLTKEGAAQEVVRAIREVVGGGVYEKKPPANGLSGKGEDTTRPAAFRRRRPDSEGSQSPGP